MMDKNRVNEILKKYDVVGSAPFIKMALKFKSEKLVEDFCKYWRYERGVGDGDLLSFFAQRFEGDE